MLTIGKRRPTTDQVERGKRLGPDAMVGRRSPRRNGRIKRHKRRRVIQTLLLRFRLTHSTSYERWNPTDTSALFVPNSIGSLPFFEVGMVQYVTVPYLHGYRTTGNTDVLAINERASIRAACGFLAVSFAGC